jgi:hypothetical protein
MKGQAFVEADFYESRKNIYHLAATNIWNNPCAVINL